MPPSPEPPPPSCLNCAAPVTGRYCAACGQRLEQRPLGLFSLLGELFAEILDSDARLWRTLRTLLLRPGALTNAWTEGRRAAYLPPFRLYFVLNVLTFLVLSMQAGDIGDDVIINGDAMSGVATGNLRERLEELDTLPPDTPGLAGRRAGLEQALAALETDREELEPSDDLNLGGGESLLVDLGYPRERVQAVLDRATADPAGTMDVLYERLPILMVLLLPVLATVLRAAYLLGRRPWVVHLVALVHLHAAVFLVVLLVEGLVGFGSLLGALGVPQLGDLVAGATAAVASVIAPVYLVRWVMVVHGHGVPMAIPVALVVAVLHLVGLFTGLVGLLLVSLVAEVVFGG